MNPDSSLSLSGHLAKFAKSIETDPLPPQVLEEAKYCLLDTIGCMLAGAGLPEGLAFAAAEKSISPGNEARVLGRRLSLSAAGAARVNGYNGDILELNDLIGGHASIGSVSAALSLAESERLSGERLVRALVAGIEVTARVNMGYRESNGGRDNRPFTQVGISSEGIPSTIGVSALTSVALGSTEGQLANALGIAGTLAGWCPVEVLFGHGGSIKPIMFGAWPASVGMLAARYARAGITGPSRLLESEVGLYATLADGYDPEILKGSRGWQLARPRRKWHACCGFLQAGVDGVAMLRRQFGTSLFDNATIRIEVVPQVDALLGSEKLPQSPADARFSGRYCVALASTGVDWITPEHSADFEQYIHDGAIADVMGRVSYVSNESLPHFSHSIVQVLGAEGERARQYVAGYKGSQDRPLSHDEVIAKFMRLGADHLARPEEYIEKLLNIETFDSLGWLWDDVNAIG
jgi:2-methylcitrate dehydratase PrpD